MTQPVRHASLALGVLLSLALGACSGSAPRAARVYTPIGDPAQTRRDLEVLAEREALRPGESAHALAVQMLGDAFAPPPPGSARDTRARLPLDRIEERIGVLDDPSPRGGALDPDAARLYTRARAALALGEPERALEFASRAVEIDPRGASIWLSLADARARTGDSPGAGAAFVRAIELGDRSVRALLACSTAPGIDPEMSLRCALQAWRDAQRGSQAERVLAGSVLGRSLIESGYLAGGAGVLDTGLSHIGPEAMRDTRYRREIVRVASRRAELRTSVGDAWLTLQHPQRALEHYESARAAMDRTPPAIVGRIVGAHLSAGRPALAAITLAEALAKDPGIASGATLGWCAAIGSDPSTARTLTDALGLGVLDASLAPSVRRVLLAHRLAATPDALTRAAAISDALADLVDAEMVRDTLDRAPSGNARFGIAASMVDAKPALAPLIGDALIRAQREPVTLVALLGAHHPLLARAVAVELGRPGTLETGANASIGSDRTDTTRPSPTRLALGIALASLRGDTDRVASLSRVAQEAADGAAPTETLTLVRALVGSGRLGEARDTISRLGAQAGVDPNAWLALAQAHALVRDEGARLDALGRAHELDPSDPRASERLVSLLAPRDNAEDGGPSETLRSVVSGVNERIPSSPLAVVLRANEMARRGLLAEAERAMVGLHAEHPHREWGLDLMLSIWGALHERGDDDALARADAWFNQRRAGAPGSAELGIAHARVLVLAGREDDATRTLADLSDRIGSRPIERAHETLVRRANPERADRLALARLERRSGIGPTLERIVAAARLDSLSTLAPAALLPRGEGYSLLAHQTRTLVSALSERLQRGTGDDDAVLAIARRARVMSETGLDALAQIEIVALAGSSSFTPGAFEGLIREASHDAEDDGALVRIALQALSRAERSARAPRLMARLSVEDGAVTPARILDLAGVLARDATPDAAADAVDELARLGVAPDAARVLEREIGTSTRPDDRNGARSDDEGRADMLYAVAVLAMFFDREEASVGMYRRVLGIDPGHVWALNDLGYQLVERGESLDEAHAMLTRAHAALPNSASVNDSLGWARYALGILRDRVDGNGAMVRAGAVSLLERALTLEDGAENATIHDHLGDALWMRGDDEDAVRAWLQAERLLRDRAKLLAASPDRNPDALSDLQDRVRAVRLKITDAETGGSPRVAPTRATRPGS